MTKIGDRRRLSAAGRAARVFTAIVVFALAGVPVSCSSKSPPPIRVGSTTSTQNSGLIAVLTAAFQAKTGIRVHVVTAGTGQCLELGRRGDVDLVLVHAREQEDEFVQSGAGVDRRDVMWNDFVIAGPGRDPAGIRGTPKTSDALRKIAVARVPFISRGDDSGTHSREKRLWADSGQDPTNEDWYTSTGQGMGRCLQYANEKQGYVLVDRGTWLAFSERIELPILHEGDESLRNEYGSILVNPARHPDVRAEGARRFQEFLTSPDGQRLIREFRRNGERLFHPHLEGG